MKQADAILRHLQTVGPITPLEALELYGCFRLAARISDIREAGFAVVTDIVEANGKHYARYRLPQKAEQIAAFG
jgi:hypothetical protein